MKTIKTLTIEMVDEKGHITEVQEINCAVDKGYKLLIGMDKNTYMINLDDYKISKINIWTEQHPNDKKNE